MFDDGFLIILLNFDVFMGGSLDVLLICKWNEFVSYCLLSVKLLIGFEENDF